MPSRAAVQLILIVLLIPLAAQVNTHPPPPTGSTSEEPVRMPNGKLQSDEILKAEHEKAIEDAKALLDLAQSLNKDLDRRDAAQVLSLGDIHKTEEIEKLAKRIRARIRQW